jgi:hypothetical protein
MTNLFISYYKASTPERQAEVDECLKRNCENLLIDRIYVISELLLSFNGIANSDKIYFIHYEGKPTYSMFINHIDSRTELNDVNIIANADIIFDETLSHLDKLKENDCWALSRWEMRADLTKHPEQIQKYGDSQDVWIFKGKIKQLGKADFCQGVLGCDNRIAYEIKKAGYNISNPSKSVHTWHLHNSNVRGYNPAIRNENTVVSQPYLNVPVTSL